MASATTSMNQLKSRAGVGPESTGVASDEDLLGLFLAGERLEGGGIGADDHRPGLLAEEARCRHVDARHRHVEVVGSRPRLHLSRPDQLRDLCAREQAPRIGRAGSCV